MAAVSGLYKSRLQLGSPAFYHCTVSTGDIEKVKKADLLKSTRAADEDPHDFSRIRLLRGPRGRDKSVRGGSSGGSVSRKRKRMGAQVAAADIQPGPSSSTMELEQGGEHVAHHGSGVFLSNEEAYTLVLKQQKAVHSLNDVFTSFTIPDYDEERMILKKCRYVILSRRAITFDDVCAWVYTCTCDVARSSIIRCCGNILHSTCADFGSNHPTCLHVRALEILLQEMDAVHQIDPLVVREEGDAASDSADSDPSTNHDTHQMPEVTVTALGDTLWCVEAADDYGVVDHQPDQPARCVSCTSSHCTHATKYREWCSDDDTTQPWMMRPRTAAPTTHTPRRYSCIPIPFQSTAEMRRVYSLPYSERFPVDENGRIVLSPHCEVCAVCGGPLEEHVRHRDSNMYLPLHVLQATVTYKVCTSCDIMYDYDGLDTLLVHIGQVLVSHEVLRRFMFSFLQGRTTIFTEYSTLAETYNHAGCMPCVSYKDFRLAWYAFVDLLAIDYAQDFQCRKCGPIPSTVVMDATSLSFRKALVSWQAVLTEELQEQTLYDATVDHHNRVQGRTLLNRAIRNQMLTYANPQRGLPADKKPALLEALRADVGEPVSQLVSHIFDTSTTTHCGNLVASSHWRPFLHALASSSPFCSFIPPNESFFAFLTNALCLRSGIHSHHQVLKRIQTTVPVIFNLLTSLHAFPFDLLLKCMPIFKAKVFYPFGETCPSDAAPNDTNDFSYFPNWPIIRMRGAFVADKKPLTKSDICTKLSKGSVSLMPGIFTIFCPCGVCYGFEVMRFSESPAVPFTILRTRFETAPDLVIYDNACSLQAYCLNRDPTFFQGTLFRVDALHFKNHTACGPSYELKSYPQHTALNSQVVEQSNSQLQRLKSSLAYMTQENFKIHCKFFLWNKNAKCNSI